MTEPRRHEPEEPATPADSATTALAVAAVHPLEDVADLLDDQPHELDQALPDAPPEEAIENARLMANRLLRALGRVETEQVRADEEHAEFVEHYTLRHLERRTVLVRAADWMTMRLRELYPFLGIQGNKKSVELMAGRLGTRTTADSYGVTDDAEAEALASCRRLETLASNLPEPLVVDTPKINRRLLRMYLKQLGAEGRLRVENGVLHVLSPAGNGREAVSEPLPGLEYKPEHETFHATPK